jgi:FkbH-like protein
MQMINVEADRAAPRQQERLIKCVVWDLDNTIWQGILLEDTAVSLRPGIVSVIKRLDERGILHSIASRNDPKAAMRRLQQFGLADYFVYPQIGWQAKSHSVAAIAQALNIGLDAIAFIDDQPFEREEVAHALPDVYCLDSALIDDILRMPAFMPRFITDDSRQRRAMIQANMAREQAETSFDGPTETFLATLEMVFTIGRAQEKDLQRAEELTVRTNQLNTTGYTYSYEELLAFSRSDDYLLLVAALDDRFGTYGRIGLALVECGSDIWNIKLLLMSCRVMSRGVGTVMLTHIMRLARAAGAVLQAEFIANDRNRMMFVTYRLAGFQSVKEDGDHFLLQHDLDHIPDFPDYVKVVYDSA